MPNIVDNPPPRVINSVSLTTRERGTIVSRFMPSRFVFAVGAVLLLAACGGSTPTGNGLGTGALTVGVIAPFTGADAGLGPAYYAACLPAALSINNSRGVVGRALRCFKCDPPVEPAPPRPTSPRT